MSRRCVSGDVILCVCSCGESWGEGVVIVAFRVDHRYHHWVEMSTIALAAGSFTRACLSGVNDTFQLVMFWLWACLWGTFQTVFRRLFLKSLCFKDRKFGFGSVHIWTDNCNRTWNLVLVPNGNLTKNVQKINQNFWISIFFWNTTQNKSSLYLPPSSQNCPYNLQPVSVCHQGVTWASRRVSLCSGVCTGCFILKIDGFSVLFLCLTSCPVNLLHAASRGFPQK